MTQGYPVSFARDTNGTIIAEVVDVPGAITVGKNRAAALDQAQDALVAMLNGYMAEKKLIPAPSRPKRGQPTVTLPPMVAAKLAIYQAMQVGNITQLELAARLGCDGRQVRRLLDLDHNSRLDQLEAALRALGKRLVVDVQNAA